MFNKAKVFKKFGFGKKLRLSVIAIILGILILAPLAAATEYKKNNIVQLEPVFKEKTYKELSAKWWQWALSIPVDRNPLTDTTGEFCAEGQSGDVWFIGGIISTQPSPIQVTRTCTIPAGKVLFFPIINAECSQIEGNGNTEHELRACAKNMIDNVTIKEVTIDGREIDVKNKYRARSDLFVFTLPKNNILGLPAGSSKAVSDGYWMMLTPLPKGQHVVYIHGGAEVYNFETKVTYYITAY